MTQALRDESLLLRWSTSDCDRPPTCKQAGRSAPVSKPHHAHKLIIAAFPVFPSLSLSQVRGFAHRHVRQVVLGHLHRLIHLLLRPDNLIALSPDGYSLHDRLRLRK
eukprot:GHVU01129882.1.p2 GENE.GHVU01129882.1~~GHVU01129882.1.p2  ORF type:complete len:107 (+),score=6.59 GHVU01129882.1:389-709(+)